MNRQDEDLARARQAAELEAQTGSWTVLRDGGQGRGMHLIYCSPLEARARRRFDWFARRMRQGCILLLDPQLNLQEYASEPMCRRRW